MNVNLLDFEMKLVHAEGDLDAFVTLLELSHQRGDTLEAQQQILARVKGKLKEIGQQLIDLSSQEVTPEQ